MKDGYYWARHPDYTYFVVLRHNNEWFCCGLGVPMQNFHESQIIVPISWPVN